WIVLYIKRTVPYVKRNTSPLFIRLGAERQPCVYLCGCREMEAVPSLALTPGGVSSDRHRWSTPVAKVPDGLAGARDLRGPSAGRQARPHGHGRRRRAD